MAMSQETEDATRVREEAKGVKFQTGVIPPMKAFFCRITNANLKEKTYEGSISVQQA